MTNDQLAQIAKDPRAYLSRGYRANKLIAAKEEQIQHWRDRAESITAQLSDMPGGGSPTSLIENCVLEIITRQEEIAEEVRALVAIERETAEAIQELITDTGLRTLLELRYINRCRWEDIATRLSYAYRWVLRLHDQALATMQQEATQSHVET